jgi:serine/threonine protein phosphatase PrpC
MKRIFLVFLTFMANTAFAAAMEPQERCDAGDSIVGAGVWHEQGRRHEMEDADVFNKWAGLYGIFDGHGGEEFVEYVRDNFSSTFHEKKGDLTETFGALEAQGKKRSLKGGTTAVVAHVLPQNHQLIVANTGDSRAILVRNGEPIESTVDHDILRPDEKKRIEAAGVVIERQVYEGEGRNRRRKWVPYHDPQYAHGESDPHVRIAGFPMSRALGDFALKAKLEKMQPNSWSKYNPFKSKPQPAVIWNPELYRWSYRDGDTLVMACDGVWDVMTNQAVAEFIARNRENFSAQKLALKLVYKTLVPLNSSDNVSAVIVKFGDREAAQKECALGEKEKNERKQRFSNLMTGLEERFSSDKLTARKFFWIFAQGFTKDTLGKEDALVKLVEAAHRADWKEAQDIVTAVDDSLLRSADLLTEFRVRYRHDLSIVSSSFTANKNLIVSSFLNLTPIEARGMHSVQQNLLQKAADALKIKSLRRGTTPAGTSSLMLRDRIENIELVERTKWQREQSSAESAAAVK